jgi:hypothetical protein
VPAVRVVETLDVVEDGKRASVRFFQELRATSSFSTLRGVEARWGDAEDAAADSDRVAGLLLLDEPERRYWIRLVSFAKRAAVNSTGRFNNSFEFSGWSDEAERLAGPAFSLSAMLSRCSWL